MLARRLIKACLLLLVAAGGACGRHSPDTPSKTAQETGGWAAHSMRRAYVVQGAIAAEWAALGGAGGLLGAPTSDELTCADGVGRYNMFQNGVIFWTPATGAHESHGAILARWAALGYERSFLGYPTADEAATPGGSGRFSRFQIGNVYWSAATGARIVQGRILQRYLALMTPSSLGFLGLPLTDETPTADGMGRFNNFQGGVVYWSPSSDAFSVHGNILAKWRSLGSEKSVVGYPIADEAAVPGGQGRYSRFQHGNIYWDVLPGANVVRGLILSKYLSMMNATSVGALGLPATDELPAGDGWGRYNLFQYGVVLWTPTTGAHEVHGLLYKAYRWPMQVLGYPTADVKVLGKRQVGTFQYGNITYNSATDSYNYTSSFFARHWDIVTSEGNFPGVKISVDITVKSNGDFTFSGRVENVYLVPLQYQFGIVLMTNLVGRADIGFLFGHADNVALKVTQPGVSTFSVAGSSQMGLLWDDAVTGFFQYDYKFDVALDSTQYYPFMWDLARDAAYSKLQAYYETIWVAN